VQVARLSAALTACSPFSNVCFVKFEVKLEIVLGSAFLAPGAITDWSLKCNQINLTLTNTSTAQLTVLFRYVWFRSGRTYRSHSVVSSTIGALCSLGYKTAHRRSWQNILTLKCNLYRNYAETVASEESLEHPATYCCSVALF
jgi:hypothetical protein